MQPGAKVKIVGLQSEEGLNLNNQEGIIDHFSRVRDRYAVSLAGESELKMIKEINLEVLEAPPAAAAVFDNEDEMMKKLEAMGMPPQMLVDLSPAQKKQMFEMTQRQGIVERARKMAGVTEAPTELKKAAGGLYSWRDASDHVYLEIKTDAAAKDVKCKIEETSIRVSSGSSDKSTIILEGNLFQRVIASQSKWHLREDGIMAIELKKVSAMRWLMVIR